MSLLYSHIFTVQVDKNNGNPRRAPRAIRMTETMLFNGRDVSVRDVEMEMRREMRAFDRLPRCLRNCGNAFNTTPLGLRNSLRRYGNDPNVTARALMKAHAHEII
jgi:hypothetical protein